MADPQRPSTWRKFKKGLCEGCFGGCCQLALEASLYDLIRLELIDEFEAQSVSLKKIGKNLKKDGVVQRFDHSNQIFVLSQKANSDCVFLDSKTRLCTVYAKRPEVCREFPKIGPRPGYCPHLKKEVS